MVIDVTDRKNISIGMLVDIVADDDGEQEKITRGYVQEIISKTHGKLGVKVALQNGKIGRIVHIPTKEDVKLENFKFYNTFFFLPKIYSIWDSANRKYLVIDHVNRSNGKTERTALLFDSVDKARSFIKGTPYADKNFVIRSINRNKPIYENFKTLTVDFFRINRGHKLSYGRLIEWENKFKNM